jgi:hypothetical protein
MHSAYLAAIVSLPSQAESRMAHSEPSPQRCRLVADWLESGMRMIGVLPRRTSIAWTQRPHTTVRVRITLAGFAGAELAGQFQVPGSPGRAVTAGRARRYCRAGALGAADFALALLQGCFESRLSGRPLAVEHQHRGPHGGSQAVVEPGCSASCNRAASLRCNARSASTERRSSDNRRGCRLICVKSPVGDRQL